MNEAKPFVVEKRVVMESWLQVKANRGSAGIDGIDLKSYESNLQKNLYKLWNRMSSGSYFPKAVKLVEIPKPNGGKRPLGIPTVEVHISDVSAREAFRQVSYIRAACAATISGHGLRGYLEAMDLLIGDRA